MRIYERVNGGIISGKIWYIIPEYSWDIHGTCDVHGTWEVKNSAWHSNLQLADEVRGSTEDRAVGGAEQSTHRWPSKTVPQHAPTIRFKGKIGVSSL
jgi:hypothetical protein